MQNIPKWLVQTIAGVLAILLIVVTISQVYTVHSKSTAVSTHTITISAEGKVTAQPDLVTVSAGVTNDADTAAQAQSDNASKMNKAIDFIKNNIGVKAEDISTSNYSIYPKYDYINGKAVASGYTANQTLVVKLHDLSKISNLLAGLTTNDINQIQNVAYTFDNPDNFREQAREQALANAKDKAQNLAKAAGVKLGSLVSFDENSSGGGPIPLYSAAKDGMGGGGNAPQVEPGTQDIIADISVTYEIK